MKFKDNIDKLTQITKQQISPKSKNQNEETEWIKQEQPFVITDKQKQAEYIWQYLQDICSGKSE